MLAESLRQTTSNTIAKIAKSHFKRQGRGNLRIQVGPLHEGAFAIGACIDQDNLFFKVGKSQFPLDFVRADLQLGSRNLPHTVKNYGVMEDNGTVYSVMEALPPSAIQLLSILRQYGLQTVQTSEQDAPSMPIELATVYQQMIFNLFEIHQQEVNLSNSQLEQALATYHHHLINGPSRLQGIANIYFQNSSRVISSEQFQLLRKKILALARLTEMDQESRRRIRQVHGDSWAANTFYLPDQQKVKFIDPELALADPALDVCFALSDLAFSDNRSLIDLAENLLNHYATQDSQIRDHLAFPFGYKAWVSAVFDAQTQEQQLTRFYSAVGAIQQGLEQKPFSFLKLNEYVQIGANQF